MRLAKVLLLALLLSALPANGGAGGVIVVLTVDDAIGPAISDYLHRGLIEAAEREASVVVIQLNTPGGLDLSMRDIIRDMLASPVPVAVYVAPAGGRAASAGTYILYAAHIAAMAPATNVGAATPVQIGGIPDFAPPDRARGGDGTADKDGEEKSANDDTEDSDGKPKAGEKAPPEPEDAMERKLINDAVAYLRSLAEMRARNAEWAERAVREGASLSAQEALANGVIDLVVADLEELLAAMDGRAVKIQGRDHRLSTQGHAIEHIEPGWRSRLLAVITNPNVAYILMLLGIYGLFFELASPGYVLPGVVGAICLLLAMYALQVLPVNYAGLALILVGVAFMVGELFVSSFGVLGIGGIIAFIAGSVILFEPGLEGFELSIGLIGAFAALSALFFMGVAALAVRIHRRRVVSGREQMIGSLGEALEDFQGAGRVRVQGESWQAVSPAPLQRGQAVRITGLDGLTLIVKPQKEEH
ncbi:MAG: nodulation protein NfeD [Gammaproteobacteria bacterium]|nr:nodulation protein NfeD [Gammaproteobacteria bacterium]